MEIREWGNGWASSTYVIIHIGTNNTSETANARMNTAAEIAEGVMEICHRVNGITPDTEIILMSHYAPGAVP